MLINFSWALKYKEPCHLDTSWMSWTGSAALDQLFSDFYPPPFDFFFCIPENSLSILTLKYYWRVCVLEIVPNQLYMLVRQFTTDFIPGP